MEYIPYVAIGGASVVAYLIMWWACGRYTSRPMRALFTSIAILLGFMIYFIIGFALMPIFVGTTAEAREGGIAIAQHFKIALTVLLVVTIGVVNARKARGPKRDA